MDDKQIILIILGIVIFALLYRITSVRIEGFGDPFAGIKKFIKQISDAVSRDIVFHMLYGRGSQMDV